MSANGRYFFEGITLGNRQPISVHPQMPRAIKGHYTAGFGRTVGPVVGAGGYSMTLTVQGQHEVPSGDFQRFTSEIFSIQERMSEVTRSIETRALLEHNVSRRKLGNVGWVSDITQKADVPVGSVIPTTGAAGSIRITVPTVNTLGLDVNPFTVGDYVMILENELAPQFSEIAQITATDGSGSSWVEITSRLSTLTGATPYTSRPTILYNLDHVYPNYVFRNATYNRPRNLSEAGAASDGISFIFEGSEKMIVRGAIASSFNASSSFTGSSIIGAGNILIVPGI